MPGSNFSLSDQDQEQDKYDLPFAASFTYLCDSFFFAFKGYIMNINSIINFQHPFPLKEDP